MNWAPRSAEHVAVDAGLDEGLALWPDKRLSRPCEPPARAGADGPEAGLGRAGLGNLPHPDDHELLLGDTLAKIIQWQFPSVKEKCFKIQPHRQNGIAVAKNLKKKQEQATTQSGTCFFIEENATSWRETGNDI